MVAVDAAHRSLLECRERWKQEMEPQLEAERERLRRLRGRQEQQLERANEHSAIDIRFKDHERFVEEVMTIEPAPYLKLLAVLAREA